MEDKQEQQIGVRVDKQLWKQFRQDVMERRGAVRGHLKTEVNNALRSYIQATKGGDLDDRVIRLENSVEEIATGIDTLVDAKKRKKTKDSDVSSTTQNRLKRIQERLDREAGDATKVHESIVHNAIEDIAGASRPTLNRYKEMMESRHIAHKWPKTDSDIWFVDTDKFVQVVSSNLPEYEYEYEQKYGEWWTDRVDDAQQERGIQ